jgi:glycerol-3-phosphate dehydrogenase
MSEVKPREGFPGPRARREADIASAEAGVDVVIVGGGINGAGAARDAAMRGLKVLLVEQDDWAVGTSSRSSKLVHGGLRYLENLEFGLVMEGTRERHLQHVLNPHLVSPLPFLMPVFRDGRHGLFKINLGLWLYDLLSLFRTPKMHRKLSPKRTLEVAPPLRSAALSGSVLYYDCQTDDARLVLANALDARRRGAIVMARACYRGASFGADGRVTAATFQDRILGRDFTVPCRHISHATGAWTDRTAALIGDPARLRPTKGVHLVVARDRLPIDVAITLSAVDDGRVVFVIPFGNTTYIGTTDTDFGGDPDAVFATREDVDYLLRTINHFFPAQALAPADVRSTWAGLRPLIRSNAATAYKTSREHEIFDDPRGLTTIAGGKLTTYRAMTEELVDHIVRDLKRAAKSRNEPSPRIGKCTTHKVALDEGARATASSIGSASELDQLLWRTHGSLADKVRARIAANPEESARVSPDLPYVLAEVAIATLDEDAWGIEDVLVRRLQVHFRAADAGASAARPVATLMARLLGRDDVWVETEVGRYLDFVVKQLACRGADDDAPLARTA